MHSCSNIWLEAFCPTCRPVNPARGEAAITRHEDDATTTCFVKRHVEGYIQQENSNYNISRYEEVWLDK